MPTKDELTDENSALRARVKELEDEASGGPVDFNGEPLEDGATYSYMDGVGLEKADAGGMRVRNADGTFSAPEEGGTYRYDGSGDLVAVAFVPGGYLYTPADDKDDGTPGELARIAEGTWKLVQGEDGAEIGTLTDEAGSDSETPVGAMNDRITMLTQDVTRLEIERNDARNEVARLKDKLRNSGTLHGHVDSLTPPY